MIDLEHSLSLSRLHPLVGRYVEENFHCLWEKFGSFRMLQSMDDDNAPLLDNGNLIVDAGIGNPFIDDPDSLNHSYSILPVS